MEDNKTILTTELKRILVEVQKIFIPVSTSIETVNNTFENLGKALEEFAKRLPSSLTILANFGWYITWDTIPGNIIRYAEELEKGNHKFVDNQIISEIDEDIREIEIKLIKNFPHRENAISSAIKAHKEGLYYLSIPVFFAQTEGICKEITGARFFSVKRGNPKTSNWVSNFKPDSFTSLILEPLTRTGVVRLSQNPENPNGLNRHDVLHGDCYDYGENKVNSYKTLSLLLYVGEIVFDSKSDAMGSQNGG